jgi:hypothetical protein
VKGIVIAIEAGSLLSPPHQALTTNAPQEPSYVVEGAKYVKAPVAVFKVNPLGLTKPLLSNVKYIPVAQTFVWEMLKLFSCVLTAV